MASPHLSQSNGSHTSLIEVWVALPSVDLGKNNVKATVVAKERDSGLLLELRLRQFRSPPAGLKSDRSTLHGLSGPSP
jgi:hypothetical protein